MLHTVVSTTIVADLTAKGLVCKVCRVKHDGAVLCVVFKHAPASDHKGILKATLLWNSLLSVFPRLL